MDTKRNDYRETKIRNIAKTIYLENKKNNIENNPDKDWIEAKSIYNNKCKYILWLIKQFHYEIVAIIAIVSLFANIFMMSLSIMVNSNSTDLNTRPYVTVNMGYPIKESRGESTFYGNDIILKNNGKIPAANVSTQYYITTDADKTNMHGLEWFKKYLGGFGSVSFIAPNDIDFEKGFRDLSPSAEYYYFEAVTSYEGLKQNKKYWTYIKKVFYVDKDKNRLYIISSYGDWDRNKKFKPPKLSTKEEVVGLLEKIKNREPVD